MQLRDYCQEARVDIAIIQEPVISNNKVYAFENNKQAHKGNLSGAVIVFLNDDIRIIEVTQFTSDHIVAVKVTNGDFGHQPITVVSAYFKYNMPTPVFIEKLQAILENEPRTLIAADVNAHSKLWFCPDRNERGHLVEEMVEDHDLHIENKQTELRTYAREGMGTSNIDVTLTTPSIRDHVTNWSIVDNTDSDHNTIVFNLKMDKYQTRLEIKMLSTLEKPTGQSSSPN